MSRDPYSRDIGSFAVITVRNSRDGPEHSISFYDTEEEARKQHYKSDQWVVAITDLTTPADRGEDKTSVG